MSGFLAGDCYVIMKAMGRFVDYDRTAPMLKTDGQPASASDLHGRPDGRYTHAERVIEFVIRE